MLGALMKSAPQMRVAARQMSVISGPPLVKISLGEKIAHGIFIAGGILAVPAWVLVNIKNYRAQQS